MTHHLQKQKLALSSGRNLDFAISGNPSGYPLVWIAGTPGSLVPVPSLVTVCEKLNVKLVSMSRAGYGESSRNKGRRIVDFVDDIKELCEHLKIEECVVGGWSGGGPHALACAARLKACKAALSVAAVAPYDAEGLDWLEGQGQDNIEETEASLAGEPTMAAFCEKIRPSMIGQTIEGIIEAMSSLLPPVDKAAMLAHRSLGEHLVETDNEGLAFNAFGWVDDSMAFVSPWGFDLSEIKVPVLLYQGSEDAMVPWGHGQWLAKNLPVEGLKVRLLEGEGHISIFVGREVEMIGELLEAAGVSKK